MTMVTHNTRAAAFDPDHRRHAGLDLALGLLPLLTLAITAWWLFDLPDRYLVHTIVAYGTLAGLVAWHAPAHRGPAGLGVANRVTLGRATLVLPIAALAVEPIARQGPIAWWIVGVAAVALVLDGVDGWMARRTGTATPFGARFDMELDSFLMLALAVLVWRSGRVGPWVVLLGLPRYLFVAAGWAWPLLQAELPPSQRRKAVCVAQGVLLLACLPPIVPPPIVSVGAAVALGLVTASFAVDIRWLLRRP